MLREVMRIVALSLISDRVWHEVLIGRVCDVYVLPFSYSFKLYWHNASAVAGEGFNHNVLFDELLAAEDDCLDAIYLLMILSSQ